MYDFDYRIKYLLFDKHHNKVFDYGVSQFQADNHLQALINLWNSIKPNKYYCYIQVIGLYSFKKHGLITSAYIDRFNSSQRKKALL